VDGLTEIKILQRGLLEINNMDKNYDRLSQNQITPVKQQLTLPLDKTTQDIVRREIQSVRPLDMNMCGTTTLVGGTVDVSSSKVTDNSVIQLTVNGGVQTNVGIPRVSARVPYTSFTITSSNALDVCDIGWNIIEPNS
jgi:hypothetical protein